MVGLMSDRASVMKSFDKKFDEHRQEHLATDESLQFLHCSAHQHVHRGSFAPKECTKFTGVVESARMLLPSPESEGASEGVRKILNSLSLDDVSRVVKSDPQVGRETLHETGT